MRNIPLLAMFVALAMAADVPPPPEREPTEPEPEPQPDPKFFVGVDHGAGQGREAIVLVEARVPGVVVVQGTDQWRRPRDPYRTKAQIGAVGREPRTDADRAARAAAQAKRDRKNRKRLQEQR